MAKKRRHIKRKRKSLGSHMSVGSCKAVKGKKGIKLCRVKSSGKGQFRFKRK